MSFAGASTTLCLILRIDLPGYNIRLSEGGEVVYDGDLYAPEDSIFGTVTAFEDYTSGQADEAPAFELTWGLKDAASAVALSNPAIQGSFVDWRILCLDRDTNAVLANQPIFVGLIDNTEIMLDRGQYQLRMGFSTEIDRILNTDKGNRLNRAFHRSVWPGETGLDMMTGTTTPVPWGDKDQRRSSGGGNGGLSTGSNVRVSLV